MDPVVDWWRAMCGCLRWSDKPGCSSFRGDNLSGYAHMLCNSVLRSPGVARTASGKVSKRASRSFAPHSAAAVLGDVRVPAGNRLERLAGDRNGQHSIRVNDTYRICFVWTRGGPVDIEITDYH